MTNLVIIGGSDAGISAALRAMEINPNNIVTVIVADRYPNFSICGLPFYLSGEIPKWQKLAHRTVDEIEKQGIQLLLGQRATDIDSEKKTVTAVNDNGRSSVLKYDKLIIGTGAFSVRPPLAGVDLSGVFTLRWMADGFEILKYLEEYRPKSALILGAGYIGMEMADALTHRGLSVSMLVRSDRILKTVDPKIGEKIRKGLERHGVKVIDQIVVKAIETRGKRLSIRNAQKVPIAGEMVILATGGLPETTVAKIAGISTGINGAICVNRAMETNIKDIYAAGDCVETWHRLLKKNIYLPLGTTAHKQGRVAGENAAGGRTEFAGSLGTQVVKIFDMVVARTGFCELEARDSGFKPLTIEQEIWDHKAYYPGATPLQIHITGDLKTHRLLGAQIFGKYGAEVSKRIDIFATSIFNEMTVESLNQLDLSYTPPLSSPWDPIQMAAQFWVKEAGKGKE